MKKIVNLLALVAVSSSAMAATNTWDGLGDGSTFEDGGNWGGTAPANDLTSDIAQFTGGTVDLSSARQVNGLDFASGSTLSGSGSIQVGTGGITVGGNSTIGTASLIASNAVGVTLNGTLGISSALVGNGDLTFTAGSANALTLTGTTGNDSSSTYSGNMTFDGVNVTANRYSLGGGQSGKTLSLLNGSSLSANNAHLVLGNRDIVIGGGATLAHARNKNIYRFDGVVSGTGGLTYSCTSASGAGSGKIQLDGTANTYTGGTTFNSGAEVWVTADGSLGASGEGLTFDDGTFYAKNAMTLTGRAITLEDGGGRFDGGAGNRVTIDSAISGTGALTVDSGGIVRIQTSGNTYTGGTTIDGSTLEVRNGGQGVLGTGTITLDNGGTIEGSANHVNNRSTTSIVIGSGGGTFKNGHTKAFYGLENATVTGSGVLTLDGGGSWNSNSRIQIAGMSNTLTNGLVMQNAANVQVSNDSDLGAAGSKVTIDNARMVTSSGADHSAREFEIASGGGLISLNNKTTTMGTLTGAGALTIDSGARNNGTSTAGGTLRMYSTGTLSGDVTVDKVNLEMGANNALGTGAITLDNGAQLKNRDSHTTLANALTIGTGGGELMAGWNKSLTLDGALSGSGGLTIVADSGTVYLNGDSTGFTGLLSLENGAKIGGSGTINGDLTVAAGGELAFSTTDTLDVAGTVTVDSTFGVDDLIGLSSSTENGTYTLIATDSTFDHIENFGVENAYDLGDGKSAYFQNGSLQVVVIPEPATLGLVVAFGSGILIVRRRFMM